MTLEVNIVDKGVFYHARSFRDEFATTLAFRVNDDFSLTWHISATVAHVCGTRVLIRINLL